MITLLLDSSNKNLSVAIANGTNIITATDYEAWQQQSELMIPEIDNLLKTNNLESKDISNIIVAIGPGSYTGVRIAVTIAKIMAFIVKAKLYTVSSLGVLSYKDKPTICLANARSNRSYFAVYQGNNVLVEDTILTNDEVFNYINSHSAYKISGDLTYLGLVGIESNRFRNMLEFLTEENEVKDLLAVKPVYLKD